MCVCVCVCCVCVCVCVCVWGVCVCVCGVCVCVCVWCVCVCVCVCVCTSMHACAVDGEGSMAFVSRALVAVWTAVYLTGYSDCLTGFRELLSPPYRCQTGMKNVWCDHWENIRVGHGVL